MADSFQAGQIRRIPQIGGSWIQSPVYDVLLFSLAPVIGLMLVLIVLHSPLGRTAGLLVSLFLIFPHYVSSFSFYLGDENWRYFRTHWVLYFLGPVLILLSVIALRVTDQRTLIGAIIIIWNVYHVSQQSAGILSVYRRLNGGCSQEKFWARGTFLFTNATMAFWFMERTPVVHDIVLWIHVSAVEPVPFVLLAGAVFCGLRFVLALSRRPNGVSLPEKCFISSSLLLFHPFIWVEDSGLATLAMLSGHVVQYLAFIWLLNRRKYAGTSGDASLKQRCLGQLSSSNIALVCFCVVVGLIFGILDKGSRMMGNVLPYWIIANTVALSHFYVDGLVWAFRKPFVARTVGPYLFRTSVS